MSASEDHEAKKSKEMGEEMPKHEMYRKKNAVFTIYCVTKGYQECNFVAHVGEEFVAAKKHGPRGKAFKVVSVRGQLGHLERALVKPFWDLNEEIVCFVTGEPFDDPRGRWRIGGGFNVPIKVQLKVPVLEAKKLKRLLDESGLRSEVRTEALE